MEAYELRGAFTHQGQPSDIEMAFWSLFDDSAVSERAASLVTEDSEYELVDYEQLSEMELEDAAELHLLGGGTDLSESFESIWAVALTNFLRGTSNAYPKSYALLNIKAEYIKNYLTKGVTIITTKETKVKGPMADMSDAVKILEIMDKLN